MATIAQKEHSPVTGLMSISAAELTPRIVERALRSFYRNEILLRAQWESDTKQPGEYTEMTGNVVKGTGRFTGDTDGSRLNDAIEFNQKVISAYERYVGIPLTEDLIKGKATTTFAHGEPGHGKSTAFMLAAQVLADLLDMRMVREPTVDYEYSPNDFVFVTENLAGQNQIIDVGGIPDVTTVPSHRGDDKRMVKRLRHSLCSAVQANASMILFDDITNASPNLQDAMLSVAETGKFQDLQLENGCVVGYTGNFGAADGTFATKLSAALKTRCSIYDVQDSLEDWCARTRAFYNDELGDCGVSDFLQEQKVAGECLFSKPIKSKREKDSPYPCPRTWSKLVTDLRPAVQRMVHGGNSPYMQALGGPAMSMSQLEIDFGSHVGPQAASALRNWIASRLTDAYPIAKSVMEQGHVTAMMEKKIKLFAGSGKSHKDKNNQRQLIRAIIDKAIGHAAANDFSKDSVAEGITAFAQIIAGKHPLHPSETIPGLQAFGERLAAANPVFKGEDGLVTMEVVDEIIESLAEEYKTNGKAPSESARRTMVAALTGQSIEHVSETEDLKMA